MNRTPATVKHCFALLLLSASPKVWAQALPDNTQVPAPETDEEQIVLSPFVVEADSDKGYRATSTLAGTRVRTELKDVGSAVSVITAQFLQDTGARSNSELLKYTTNTEVGGVGGTFTGLGNGRELGEGSALLRPNSNTRVRGLTAADNTRDFFLTEIPWDSYNVGRVDIQRGPNAILFGMGSPAGIINTSTNQASFKESGKVEFRTDQYGSARGVLDLNHVLLKNELALRLSAVSEHAKYRQKPAFQKQERIYGDIRFDPKSLKKNGMSTSIRANFEKGDITANRPRSMPPADGITPWFTEMGKKVYNPYRIWNQEDALRATRIPSDGGGINPNFNPWLGDFANIYGNTVSVFGNPSIDQQSALRGYEINGYWGIGPGGTMDDRLTALAKQNNYYGLGNPGAWDNGLGGYGFARQIGVNSYATYADYVLTPTATDPFHQGLPYKAIGAYKDKQIDDANVFDFYNQLLDGNNKREEQGYEAYNLKLAQTFFNNRLGFEAAYDSQKYEEFQNNGLVNRLYIDINSYTMDVAANPNGLPTPGGAENPNVGQALVKTDGNASRYNSDSEAMRVTGFGELRLDDFLNRGLATKILGRHIFTGMLAKEEKDSRRLDFVQHAFDSSYAYMQRGVEPYSLYSRSVPVVAYISANLSGVNSPGELHLNQVQNNLRPSLVNGQFFGWDSHWKHPYLPSQAGYVNPADFWDNPQGEGAADTQAENPANYRGWSMNNANLISYDQGGEGQLYTGGLKTWREVKSQAFVWQGYLMDDLLVPMVGWRRDEYKGGSKIANRTIHEQIFANDPLWFVSQEQEPIAGESISYSVVAHSPKFITKRLPWGTRFDVFYNRSENFRPTPGDVDMYGQTLANPTGKTKDYGFAISTLDDRLNLKVNWYETKVANDRLQGFEFWRIAQTMSTLLGSAYRVRAREVGSEWKWDYSSWTQYGGQARADEGAQIVQDAYNNNEVFKSFVDGWKMSAAMTSENGSSIIPPGVTASTDTVSKGIEFELSAEPVKGWSTSVNVSKTTATQNNIGGALKEWIDVMDPIFNGPAGDLRQWWAGDGNNFRTIWSAQVMSQFNRLKAQEGTNVPEMRPWRANVVSTYNFQDGRLKGAFLGGGYRWEDSVVVGYPVITRNNPTTNQSEMVFDVNNPFHGPTENHIDLWLGYSRKLTSKVNWRIQLNVRDLFAKKELIPISVQPDGSGAAYRIPELTSWSLTNTFEF